MSANRFGEAFFFFVSFKRFQILYGIVELHNPFVDVLEKTAVR